MLLKYRFPFNICILIKLINKVPMISCSEHQTQNQMNGTVFLTAARPLCARKLSHANAKAKCTNHDFLYIQSVFLKFIVIRFVLLAKNMYIQRHCDFSFHTPTIHTRTPNSHTKDDLVSITGMCDSFDGP